MPKILLAAICDLYLNQGLSAAKVAEHLGVSRQAISNRLKRAGVQIRPVGPSPPRFDKATLQALYVDERLSAKEVAERLGTKSDVIRREMRKLGIIHRPRRKRHIYPQLRKLNIGKSVDLPKSNHLNPYTQFYKMAKQLGIRVSVQSIDALTMRVKRIE